MDNKIFLRHKDTFTLNTLKCLRNEYFHNDCRLCFDMCNENALGLFKEKITLFKDKCTSCGECIGICPSEALSLDTFDVNDFVINFPNLQKENIIEKIDIPSLSMFDTYHLISLVIRNKCDIALEHDENTNQNILNYISNKVELSNSFLNSLNIQNRISVKAHTTQLEDNKRRGLFKNIFNAAQELKKEQQTTKKLNENDKQVPVKNILFKNSIKMIAAELQNNKIDTNKSFIFNKDISYDKCTNCCECITFCPTEALFQGSAKSSILFQPGKCIGCGICIDVCKEDAIEKLPSVDIVTLAFDQASELVTFNYEICQECRQPFVYKGGDKVCSRCIDYTESFKDMFAMAKDIR